MCWGCAGHGAAYRPGSDLGHHLVDVSFDLSRGETIAGVKNPSKTRTGNIPGYIISNKYENLVESKLEDTIASHMHFRNHTERKLE